MNIENIINFYLCSRSVYIDQKRVIVIINLEDGRRMTALCTNNHE